MIIKESKTEIITSDNFEKREITISPNATKKLIEMITSGIYSNPIGSIIRELSSNCYDAHIAANQSRNFEVEIIDKNIIIGSFEDKIIFRDFGNGLNKERINDIYCQLLETDKEDSNEYIGAYGIGSKSPFAYCEEFNIITYIDSIKTTYQVQKTSDDSIELFTLNSEKSDEENKTEVIVPIKEDDISDFKSEIQHQLGYFNNLTVIGADFKPIYPIYISDNVFIRSFYNSSLKCLIGSIVYPLDEKVLKEIEDTINYRGKGQIVLKFKIGEIKLSLNRESIRYTKETIKTIINKFTLAKKDITQFLNNQFFKQDSIIKYIFGLTSSDMSYLFEFINKPFNYKYKEISKDIFKLSLSYFKFNFIKGYNDMLGSYHSEFNLNEYTKAFLLDPKSFPFYLLEQGSSFNKKKNNYLREYYKALNLSSNCLLYIIQYDKESYFNNHILEDFVKFGFSTKEKFANEINRIADYIYSCLKKECISYNKIVIPDDFVFNTGKIQYIRKKINPVDIFVRKCVRTARYDERYDFVNTSLKDIFSEEVDKLIWGYLEDESKLRQITYIIENGPESEKDKTAVIKISKGTKNNILNLKNIINVNVNDLFKNKDELIIKFNTAFKINLIIKDYEYLECFSVFNNKIYNNYTYLLDYSKTYYSEIIRFGKSNCSERVDLFRWLETDNVYDVKVIEILDSLINYCKDIGIFKYFTEIHNKFQDLNQEEIDLVTDILKIKDKEITFSDKVYSIDNQLIIKGKSLIKKEFFKLINKDMNKDLNKKGQLYSTVGKKILSVPFYKWKGKSYVTILEEINELNEPSNIKIN